jgi:hypothetical protein
VLHKKPQNVLVSITGPVMTCFLFMIYHSPCTSTSSFYSWLAANYYFFLYFVFKGSTIKCNFIPGIALLSVFIPICVSLFRTSHSAERLSCYSCHMKIPVTGNYRCFLARYLIVIVGYVNLTSTCYNSILLYRIVRWIEETFLVFVVRLSYTNYI